MSDNRYTLAEIAAYIVQMNAVREASFVRRGDHGYYPIGWTEAAERSGAPSELLGLVYLGLIGEVAEWSRQTVEAAAKGNTDVG